MARAKKNREEKTPEQVVYDRLMARVSKHIGFTSRRSIKVGAAGQKLIREFISDGAQTLAKEKLLGDAEKIEQAEANTDIFIQQYVLELSKQQNNQQKRHQKERFQGRYKGTQSKNAMEQEAYRLAVASVCPLWPFC